MSWTNKVKLCASLYSVSIKRIPQENIQDEHPALRVLADRITLKMQRSCSWAVEMTETELEEDL
ncbi:hypothetical protein K457DRAFT_24513 [Linnemannia elongata AG-77]|uniref:Uncharacterized protein n=1 Tax=Linnemannia elongata AG-77 TaxID=1314771 RepID=A0A197JHP2_9FUNG|nr:hypothetical protein K457DRAFT_24513 [Linnemannia elongata AG-77]